MDPLLAKSDFQCLSEIDSVHFRHTDWGWVTKNEQHEARPARGEVKDRLSRSGDLLLLEVRPPNPLRLNEADAFGGLD